MGPKAARDGGARGEEEEEEEVSAVICGMC